MSSEDSGELHDILGHLVQASHRLTRIAASATKGVQSPATWRTLSVLQTSGAMRLGELAAQSRVSQPTMTKIVAGLVETEWIMRIVDADDARAWQIAITPKGGAALDGWRDQIATALLPLFDDLGPEDIAAMRRATDVLLEHVARATGPATS
jgi:DNA-binding MarR family transcriptional regulator